MKPTSPYSLEPDNPRQYTRSMDQAYTWFAGFYDVIWDGRNDTGRTVAAGVYIYQLKAENLKAVRRMLLLK